MNEYNFWGNAYAPRDIKLKSKNDFIQYHMREKFTKTIRMFKYENLPDTITPRDLELGLQYNGYMIAIMHNDKFYVLQGSLGGVQNQNFMPTTAVIANPYLNISRTYKINEDCVVIPNDSLYRGLLPLNAYYANRDAENDISLNAILKNARANIALVATDSSAEESCRLFFKDLDEGKTRVIVDEGFEETVKSLPLGNTQTSQNIVQLLESIQYFKGSWLNEVGVQSNYNMKRETITSNENVLNVDNLLLRVDDMYESRLEAFEKIHSLFGIDIKFDYNSSWAKLRVEIEKTLTEDNSKGVQMFGQVKEKGGDESEEKVEE